MPSGQDPEDDLRQSPFALYFDDDQLAEPDAVVDSHLLPVGDRTRAEAGTAEAQDSEA